MLRHEALVRTDVSEEFSASIIRLRRIDELGTLAVTSTLRMLQRNTKKYGVTSQKTPFFFCFLLPVSVNIYDTLWHHIPGDVYI
jgi:hypothetical protein